MSFIRDLTWQYLEETYRSSVSYHLARYALGLSYDLIPQEVIHQGRRCLLDSLGCAIGAFDTPGRIVLENTLQELGGTKEATVFGSGIQTSAANAALLNSFLVRFLDYNDVGGGGHNSDSIPAVLAVAERGGASGIDCLTALIISYELGARVTESIPGPSCSERGWTFDIRGGISMPPSLGKLMGLSTEQIANAIGICTSHSLPLGVLDAHNEANTMSKDVRFGFVAYNAVIACLLAKNGFTGPVRVIEGDSGLREVILKGDMDLGRLVDFSGWRILDTRHKYICANANSHGHIFATLAIVKEHNIKPEEVTMIRIKAGLRESRHTTTAPKKYPRDAENANHSAYFANAMVIKERRLGPDCLKPEFYTDPVILELIEKMTVEADPSLPEQGYAGISEITTRDGRRFSKRIDVPHGFGDDPLSDAELEAKFKEMASKCMDEEQIKSILDTVWNFERVRNVRELTRLLILK